MFAENRQIAPSPSLNRFRSQREIETLNVEKYERHVLAVENKYAQNQLEIYQWREQTDFPIVKVDSFKVTHKKMGRTYFQILMSTFNSNLSHFTSIPLFKVLYLMKESFIGLERLADKFGHFIITPEMIGISSKNRCKVWINQNYSLNHTQQIECGATSFYQSCITLFEERCYRNISAVQFFASLKTTKSFWEGLRFIDQFSKANKIIVPKEFRQSEWGKTTLKKNLSAPGFEVKDIPFVDSPKKGYMNDGVRSKIQQKEQENNLRRTITHESNSYSTIKKAVDNYTQQKGALTFSKSDRHLTKKIEEMMSQRSSSKSLLGNVQKPKHFSNIPKRIDLESKGLKKVKSGGLKYDFTSKNKPASQRKQTEFSVIQTYKQPSYERTSWKPKTIAKNIERKNETRNTTIVELSKETQQSRLAFGSNSHSKISQISHKRRSGIEEFNRDVESLLYEIDNKNESRVKAPSRPNRESQKTMNISTLEMTQKIDQPRRFQGMTEAAADLTKTEHLKKYGQIKDDPQQLTFNEIKKNFEDRGWNRSINHLMNTESDLKRSIHSNIGEENKQKTPVSLKHLDKIKGPDYLNESFEDD